MSLGRGRVTIGAFDALDDLSDEERALVASFGAERRRMEFVAGRRAARLALAALDVTVMSIGRANDGAPMVEGASLSITHGRFEAHAVATREGALGVDLTDHTDAPRIRRVAKKAFPCEAERAAATRDDASLVRAWALKEAVAKALRIGMLEQAGVQRITIVDLAAASVEVDGAPPALVITVEDLADGVLVIARA